MFLWRQYEDVESFCRHPTVNGVLPLGRKLALTRREACGAFCGDSETNFPDDRGPRTALSNLREVIGKLVFVDDENVFPVRLNKPQVAKSLHEQADPRPSRTHHLGQFIVRYL